ncbi:transposase [Xanthobacter autotrophicus]|uniref:transposase n=1 Tax=Xanthobacter autotrophicus TaxID=280 RepID=UPI00372D7FEA
MLAGRRSASHSSNSIDSHAGAGCCNGSFRGPVKPRDIVIIDNLGSHTSEMVRHLIGGAGAGRSFLPPYSSDLNAIE